MSKRTRINNKNNIYFNINKLNFKGGNFSLLQSRTILDVNVMNNKANTLMSNVIYVLFLLVFVAGVGLIILSKMNSASVLADFYVKETAKTINLASH